MQKMVKAAHSEQLGQPMACDFLVISQFTDQALSRLSGKMILSQ